MDNQAEVPRGVRRIPTVGILIIAFLVLLSGIFVAGQFFTEDVPAGEAAPDVTLPVLGADGELAGTLSLTELRGKPVVVNFFAAWCAPCVRELPDFETVHGEMADQITFVGINVNDRPGDAVSLVDETGISYRVLVDQEGGTLGRFNDFEVMPTTAFIAADGSLVHVNPGIISIDDLRGAIDEHLLEEPVEQEPVEQ